MISLLVSLGVQQKARDMHTKEHIRTLAFCLFVGICVAAALPALASGMHPGKYHPKGAYPGYCSDGGECLISKRTHRPIPSTYSGGSAYRSSEKRELKY
jgi:hypothetical protein